MLRCKIQVISNIVIGKIVIMVKSKYCIVVEGYEMNICGLELL